MIQNNYIKVSLIIIVIIACFALPMIAYDDDVTYERFHDSIWQELNQEKINELVQQGKVVFIKITADWCVTCKFNEFMVLDTQKALNFFKREGVVAMVGDVTKDDPYIEQYMMNRNVVGIPYYVVYGPNAPNGIELPVLIDLDILKNTINLAVKK